MKQINNVKLSPPWITFVNELKALFENDPDVHIEFSDDECATVKLYVERPEKCDALTQLLPPVKEFGYYKLYIKVIPANLKTTPTEDIIRYAFKGNPILENTMVIPSPFGDMIYAVFAKKVVQFPNDDMSDPNGLESTLYENIAKDVFESKPNTFWCTSSKDIPLKDGKNE